MLERKIGPMTVSALGLGGAPWSVPEPSNTESTIETLTAAVASGIRLIDTAHAYTTRGEGGHNERLVATALASLGNPRDVMVATKGGQFREGDTWPIDGRPETIKRHCQSSLTALGREQIDLYQLHWPDPSVPISDSVGAIADLQQEGKVAHIGVSNVDLDQLEEARTAATLVSVQNPARFNEQTLAMIETCQNSGLTFLAYAPLGGRGGTAALNENADLQSVASELHSSVVQVVLMTWIRLAPCIIPIVGARRRSSVLDSARSPSIDITENQATQVRSALARIFDGRK